MSTGREGMEVSSLFNSVSLSSYIVFVDRFLFDFNDTHFPPCFLITGLAILLSC